MKVLVADDSAVFRHFLRDALVSWGFEAVEAVDGNEAWAVLSAAAPPRIAILDWEMPGRNGPEVCRLVKEREQTEYTYTILLTGKSGKEDVLDGFAAGADDYLTKKMDPEELRSRLNAGKRVVQYEERLREQEFQVRLKCYQALTELAEARDADTGSHLKRLSALSVCLADRLGMPREFVKQLNLFAPMHDIGKVGIPDSILLAPRRLTEDEFKIMQSHSSLGWEILDGKPTLEMAADIAYTHHERWNGAGYPRGLSGDEIPLSGRIVAITDVYDALRSERPYKQGWSHEKTVLHIMKEAGQHFDPQLTDVFWSERGRILDIFESLQDAR